jgi:taurine--2-oxoglutarate transaminase
MMNVGIRGRLEKLLADICPGDINTFMFPSSGAEANEGAIRMARRFTGRSKIMSRHRSYHGGTTAALAATGDYRRWAGEGLASGDFVKFWDPYPYSFSLGESEEEVCAVSLAALSEAIGYEGPHNVAAILIESITGTNGVLPPPRGYLEGIRELCDQHGILLICDEVMAGFGRSGKIFGFCHAPTVRPLPRKPPWGSSVAVLL